MVDKVVSVADAIAVIEDGDYGLCLGICWHRHPPKL